MHGTSFAERQPAPEATARSAPARSASGSTRVSAPGANALASIAWRRSAATADAGSHSSGAAIASPPAPVKSATERATGVSLSDVRVHTGDDVDHAARSIGALGFTAGRDIHLDRTAYRPGTSEGNALVAHELTHAAQQRASVVSPTAALSVDRLGGASEHEAESLGQRIASGDTGAASQSIVSRPVQVARKVSFYEREGVKFETAGAGSTFASWQGRGYWKEKIDGVYDVMFVAPNRLASDAEERDAVTSVMWKVHEDMGGAPKAGEVEKIVSIPPRGAKTTTLVYRLTYKAAGKGAKARPSLVFQFLGDTERVLPSSARFEARDVPKDYRKDFIDLQIENLQSRATDKLGSISGIDKVPADERQAVGYAIYQYFEAPSIRAGVKVKARDFEVDSIVPMPDGRKILYSFDFEPKTNDVIVKRVGQEGKDVELDPAKRTMDVRRVKGFDPKANASGFTSWVTARYKGLSPKGTSVGDRINDVNKSMNADADKDSWFASNYSMTVLDATAGAKQLGKAGRDAEQQKGTKPFLKSELRLIELTLQLLGGKMLDIVRGMGLVRQDAKIDKVSAGGGKPKYKANAEAGAESFSSPPTIAFYNLMHEQTTVFIGDRVGKDIRALPMSAESVAHEFGHFAGWASGTREAFNKLFADKGAKLETAPITGYAMKSPSGEYFPEAYAIYQADPAWMQANLPDMFKWFQALESTGKPPAP